jgi:hypothetical protein
MSRSTFELIRGPVALVLIALAALILWPRGGSEPVAALPTPSVIVGTPGGEALPASVSPSPPTPIPTVSAPASAPASATPTPEPTPATAEDGFTAEVHVCRSISGSQCNEELATVPANASSFTALVLFTDANGGDAINVTLSGPAGDISSGPYTLQGGGDGYYYSTFQAGGLPGGEYSVTAARNGDAVATTQFRKAGG